MPYSEFFQPSGEPRPHVARLLEHFRGHDAAAHTRLKQSLQRRLRQQEASYNIMGSPDGTNRRWVVDEIPHVLSAEEFSGLEAGLRSRAQLLEMCAQDIYGDQNLVRNGIVPPQLVQGNPHYFRALRNIVVPGGNRLILYAADVVRASDGSYVVQSDRTGAPAGSGYALENRLALGQVLSEPFQELRVRKVNRFFRILNQTLLDLAPDSTRFPRVVLLTPGVHDESSFEHGYLARYLGFELVEGRDLTVRGNDVFLKTLEGLKKVDVIKRRIFDAWCDPLELREGSLLGVAGLVGAARAGNVAIANPLGSVVVESPAFRAYLPAIARFFGMPSDFLPSIESRYLGDSAQMSEVMGNPDPWVFRPAFFDRKGGAKPAGQLPPEDKKALLERVRADPENYVAEQWPEPSRVPLSLERGTDGSLSLRMFACRETGGQFSVMSGGLARVEDDRDGLFLSTNEGRISKDVWVLGGAETEEPSLPRMPGPPLEIRRGGIDVPSRLLDDVFWLARYVERAHGGSRVIRVGLEAIADSGFDVAPSLREALLMSLVELQVLNRGTKKDAPFEGNLLSGIFDEKLPGSIRRCMTRVHGLTTATRSRLSVDTWNVLRRASALFDAECVKGSSAREAIEHLDHLLVLLAAFVGNTGSNMVRGYSWIFLELGRRIEHAVSVLTLIKHMFKGGESNLLMETLLRICDSQLTYRSRYLSTLQATPVVDLVLTDDTNPQSVIYQVQRLLWCVRALPQEHPFPRTRAEQRLVSLEAQLITSDLARACRGEASDLREMAEDGIHLLWQVSDDLTRRHFTHATRSHAVAPNEWADARLESDS